MSGGAGQFGPLRAVVQDRPDGLIRLGSIPGTPVAPDESVFALGAGVNALDKGDSPPVFKGMDHEYAIRIRFVVEKVAGRVGNFPHISSPGLRYQVSSDRRGRFGRILSNGNR